MHVRTPTPALLARVPVQLYAFDVLHLGTRPTLDQPYTRRRRLLADLRLDYDLVQTRRAGPATPAPTCSARPPSWAWKG
jgi:bifunctional non-homologous end joining protein LigD